MTRHTFVRRRVFSVCEEVALGQRSSSAAVLDTVLFFFSTDSGAKCNTKQWSESRVRLSRLSQTAPGSSGTRAEHFSREILSCYTQKSFEKIQQEGNVVFFLVRAAKTFKSHITRSHFVMSSNYLLIWFCFFSAFFVTSTLFLNFSLLFFNLIALISHTCLVFPSLPLSSSAAPVFNCPAHPSVF